MFRRRTSPQTAAQPGATSTTDHRAEVIDDANFHTMTADRPTVVDLWAPWCGPCRSFRPIFDDVAARWSDRIRFGTCNVDENAKTAALLQVQSIPTCVAFGPDGSEVARIVGVPSRTRFEGFVADLAARESAGEG